MHNVAIPPRPRAPTGAVAPPPHGGGRAPPPVFRAAPGDLPVPFQILNTVVSIPFLLLGGVLKLLVQTVQVGAGVARRVLPRQITNSIEGDSWGEREGGGARRKDGMGVGVGREKHAWVGGCMDAFVRGDCVCVCGGGGFQVASHVSGRQATGGGGGAFPMASPVA